MSNRLSNDRVADIIRHGIRGTLRSAANAAFTDKGAAARVLRAVGMACLKQRAGLPPGPVALASTARITNLHYGPRSAGNECLILRDVATDAIVGFGTRVMVLKNLGVEHLPNIVPDEQTIHIALCSRELVNTTDPLATLAFKVATWNLCTVLDGSTPAMRAGMSPTPMGPWSLYCNLLGHQIEHDESIDDSPIVVERPTQPEPIPSKRSVRDAAIMSREFGRLRVLEIHCYEPNARKPKNPEIAW